MIQPKAVVFTHFGSLKYREDLTWSSFEYFKEVDKYKPIFSNYLECSEFISIVYVYVDWGIQNAPRDAWVKDGRIQFSGKLINQDDFLIGLLERSEAAARSVFRGGRNTGPIFEYIGLRQLTALLIDLVEIDPPLLNYLSGIKDFTYDSPKFVEAIIRIARGSTAHLACHPIIRLDEDVKPYPSSIKTLLDNYSVLTKQSPFFFFSGTYGSKETGAEYDPINDHAVRVHWFIDEDDKKKGKFIPNESAIKHFLADLNELGATQIKDSSDYYSENLKNSENLKKKLEDLKKLKNPYPGRSPQVISGAGLIMSYRAIILLPPLMNFEHNIVWVDDYLKRRLHEALKDLNVDDTECIEAAKFKQCRYPPPHPQNIQEKRCDCIREGDIKWARENYFDRLLRGCIFRRLITHLNEPTEYTKLICDIVRYKKSKSDWKDTDKENYKLEMTKQAEERYEEVLTCWTSEEFEGYASYEWAQEKQGAQDYKKELCESVVDDTLGYIDLVLDWPVFIRAIKRLYLTSNLWLFTEVEDELLWPPPPPPPPRNIKLPWPPSPCNIELLWPPSPPPPVCDKDLFICYSSRFKEQAEQIQQKAKEKNLKVFLDKKDIEFGEDFSEKIKENLISSRELCVLVTPDALEKEWIISEWGAAWALNKRITPILHRCDVNHLPDRLKRFEVVDLNDIDKYLNQVKDRKEQALMKAR